jgi:hypothetical protein
MVVFQLVHSVFERVLKIEQIKGLFIAVLGNHHLRRLLAQNRASIRRKIDRLPQGISLSLSVKNWEAENNA